jgi:PhnB protein
MQVEPYLFFEGRCDEALEFYRRALGAEVTMLMRYRESPDPAMHPPGAEDKVMHANLRIGNTTIMASDGRCEGPVAFQGFALSLSLTDKEEAQRFFAALSKEGQIQMPLSETFFSPLFGMVEDRFGVLWMINVMA